MRIVVDLRGCETDALDPDRRRAVLDLVSALTGTRGVVDLGIVLTDRRPHRLARLRRDLARRGLDGRVAVVAGVEAGGVVGRALARRIDAVLVDARTRDLEADIVFDTREPGDGDDAIARERDVAEASERLLPPRVDLTSLVTSGMQSGDDGATMAARLLVDLVPAMRHGPLAPATQHRRLRLAFVSPMPPERTGVATYNARLLPVLARRYAIDVISDQAAVQLPEGCAAVAIRDPAYLIARYGDYDRILYHVGNSPYHAWMLGLLRECPGTIAMHDVYLGDLANWIDAQSGHAGYFQRALLDGHGYDAAALLTSGAQRADLVRRFPCHSDVVDAANGVIVHSRFAAEIVSRRFPRYAAPPVALANLCREVEPGADRAAARARLGIDADAFVVASFGFVNHVKLHDRIVGAWLASTLAADAHCRLIFVGAGTGDPHAESLRARIAAIDGSAPIVLTGFVNDATYIDFLVASDVAVQLRSETRGETSGAILDCLAYGLPVITSSLGALAELPPDVVLRVREQFTDDELGGALETLRSDAALRAAMSRAAISYVATHHDPEHVARQYTEALEHFARHGPRARYARDVDTLARAACEHEASGVELDAIAEALADNTPRPGDVQWLLDITPIVATDLRTGIERVVRAVLQRLLHAAPLGVRIEPVHFDNGRFIYSRRFVARWLGLRHPVDDCEIEPRSGDRFIGLAWSPHAIPEARGILARYRNLGVHVGFVVYDLLPLGHPDWFPPGLAEQFRAWFDAVAALADRIICISRHVADEVRWRLEAMPPRRFLPLAVAHFPLGSDVEASVTTVGLPDDAQSVLAMLSARPAFLMVGTVEPRKGHRQVVEAFDELWRAGHDFMLVVAGKRGWMTSDVEDLMRSYQAAGLPLLRLESVSDEYLAELYACARAVIVASYGEGFGLPIVEAARHGTPVIARDLDVFHEVAHDGAMYFRGDAPADLAGAILAWQTDDRAGHAPPVARVPLHDWAEATGIFVDAVQGGRDTFCWQPQPGSGEVEAEAFDYGIGFADPGWPEALTSMTGLSGIEPWGRWSDASRARTVALRFARPLPHRAHIALTARAFGDNARDDTIVRVGETRIPVRFGATDSTVAFDVETDGGEYVMEIMPPAPVSPASIGMSADTRELGIGLVRLEITATDLAAASAPGKVEQSG
jgi:glycosyltransferase involved in cell wall biosynthesis